MELEMFSSPEMMAMDKLSKWDGAVGKSLAPLSAKQNDSFLELASISSNRVMPIEVPLEEPVNIVHKVSVKGVIVPGSMEDTLAQGFARLGMAREKVENAQQFYNWFSKIEDQMSKIEAEDYMEHIDNLKHYCDYCRHIIDDVDNALDSLDKLGNEYVSVSTKTNALHDACEHLLADQTALINSADAIHENLEYFLEHDRINKKLSSPNLQVTGDSFQEMLTRMDECIEFMKAHSTYKDASLYMTKYKTSLSVALEMIKSFVVKSLESTTQSILNRKNENASKIGGSDANASLSSDDAFTLYYGKFRTNAPKIKGLMEQIELRAEKTDEYQRLLTDIHYCYFTQRELLLSPSITSAMSDLVSINKQDHCALVRSGCAFMVHVCEDEHQLYSHFFSAQTAKLHEMLLRLCGNLYDLLRPLIIHIYHLETLAELCNILKTEMIDDHVLNNPEQLQAFHSITLQMLEDVQERLVYRANIYIRDDIRNYKSSPGDIAYPEKLQMMEEIARNVKKSKIGGDGGFTEIKLDDADHEGSNLSNKLEDSLSSADELQKPLHEFKFQTSPADMHGMWFPTVRRVLVCLSKLYRCIDKTIFQGLSQEALEACVHSLVNASSAIKKNTKANSTEKKVMDGELFLIKHLLILREQIAPFHAEFAIKETQLDFSRTKDAAFRFVLEPRSLPNLLRVNSNNSLLQLLYEGTPEVKEYYIDSKKDVDRQLKMVCEEFIQVQTKRILGPLSDFLTKALQVLRINNEEGGTKVALRQQPFATTEVLHNQVAQIYRDLKLGVKKTATSMSLYLANKETENILFKPIKLNVQQAFQQLHMILLENYSDEDQAIIAAPSSDQVGIVSLSNFALNLARGGNELHRTCLIQISFTVLPCAASVFSMTIVSVDRYLTIMHPLKYQVFIKIWKGIFIIVIAWTFALLIGFAPFMGWSIINEDFTSAGSNCTFLHIVDSSYVIFMFFGLFLPQLFLVIYLYFKIFKVTRKHTKLLARSKNTPRTSSTRENEFEFDAEHRNRPRFTQSCPVSPVMSRINIRKDTNFALRNIHSRTVNFNPVSINIEPENNQSVSSLSNSSVFFEPTNDKETKPKLPSMSLPGSAVLPEALPKAATTTYEYVTFDNALRSHTRRKNDAHKLRRTVSYAGSAAISSFALQLSHKLKSYSRLGRVVPKRDLKALRTVAMVIGFFCLMWTPFQIVSIIQVGLLMSTAMG